MRRTLVVGAMVAVLASLVGWTAGSHTVTWEYQEIGLSASESATPKLNQLGAAGWELVSVVSACAGSTGTCSYYAYFKRPK